eukprot:1506351-Rhodomonas_salina.1
MSGPDIAEQPRMSVPEIGYRNEPARILPRACPPNRPGFARHLSTGHSVACASADSMCVVQYRQSHSTRVGR